MAPILVRPLAGRYQIVDGEHRFRIARDLGISQVPCVIKSMDDNEARIKTLQMNGLRGENDPDRLASLIAFLAHQMGVDLLSGLLPWSAFELEELIALAPQEEVESAVRKAAAGFAAMAPLEQELFAVVVTTLQKGQIDAAIKSAQENSGVKETGEALSHICRSYLDSECGRPAPTGDHHPEEKL